MARSGAFPFQLARTNDIIQKESEVLQSASTNMKQREESDRKMVNDLMVVSDRITSTEDGRSGMTTYDAVRLFLCIVGP